MAYDGKIMRLALQEFEKDRAQREAEEESRRERIFRRQPRLREIEGELRSTMSRIITGALRRGTDPGPAIQALRDENLSLQAEKRELLERMGGWNFFTLTEDIEFTVDSVIRGECIGYSGNAILYDEQPTTFQQSWTQRMRWSRGFYQIVLKYGRTLAGAVVHPEKKQKRFTCFDLTMTVMPMIMVTIALLITDLILLAYSVFGPIFMPHFMTAMIHSLTQWLFTYYMALFSMGAITMVFEWKRIKCPVHKRIIYTFTYPLFMMTYIPISIAALFGKVEWKPIQHRVAKTLDEVR